MRDGTLATSRGVAAPFGTGSFDVSGSVVTFAPGNAGVGITSNVAHGAESSKFSFGPGASLRVRRGANPSLTVNVGNAAAAPNSALERQARGTLVVQAGSGVASLGTGTGEKIVVNGGVGLVNTLIPGAVGTTSLTTTIDPLTYSAATQRRRLPHLRRRQRRRQGDLRLGRHRDFDEPQVVEQLTDLTLGGNAAAAALKVGNGAAATPGNTINTDGNTITIGDGVAPGMVVLNTNSNITGGTLAFGGSRAVIYSQNGATLNAVSNTVSSVITGSNGFSKIGPGVLVLNAAATYTGATDISNGTLTLGVNDAIPVGTDLTLQNATLNLNGRTISVNSIKTSSFSTAAGTLGNSGSVINFGSAGMLKITGSGNDEIRGSVVVDTGAFSSTIWKAGAGTLTLGVDQHVTSFSAGIGSPVMSYNKLWATDGGVISLVSSNSIPNNPTGGVAFDTYKLDNGTLRIGSVSYTALGAGGGSTVTVGGNRGLSVGAGGGTIDVPNIQEVAPLSGRQRRDRSRRRATSSPAPATSRRSARACSASASATTSRAAGSSRKASSSSRATAHSAGR